MTPIFHHPSSGLVRTITGSVITTVLHCTDGLEQALRALSQAQPNWLGLSPALAHTPQLCERPPRLSPAVGDDQTDGF